ncbi:unnamed protein product [Amoebophrya sp. A25]|nr:unnamed protein product [Amoebophrya sp. A25]|eukprot:GSA25T00020084001.1
MGLVSNRRLCVVLSLQFFLLLEVISNPKGQAPSLSRQVPRISESDGGRKVTKYDESELPPTTSQNSLHVDRTSSARHDLDHQKVKRRWAKERLQGGSNTTHEDGPASTGDSTTSENTGARLEDKLNKDVDQEHQQVLLQLRMSYREEPAIPLNLEKRTPCGSIVTTASSKKDGSIVEGEDDEVQNPLISATPGAEAKGEHPNPTARWILDHGVCPHNYEDLFRRARLLHQERLALAELRRESIAEAFPATARADVNDEKNISPEMKRTNASEYGITSNRNKCCKARRPNGNDTSTSPGDGKTGTEDVECLLRDTDEEPEATNSIYTEDESVPWDPEITIAPPPEHVQVKTCWNRTGVEPGKFTFEKCCSSSSFGLANESRAIGKQDSLKNNHGDEENPQKDTTSAGASCWNGRQYTHATCCLNETLTYRGRYVPNTSKQWRLVVTDPHLGSWHVKEIEFYSNPQCSIRAMRSVSIDGGYRKLHFASNAFDAFSFGFYFSKPEPMPEPPKATESAIATGDAQSVTAGLHWLGSKLVFAEQVFCIRIRHENMPFVGPVRAEMLVGESSWVAVREFQRVPGGRSVILRLFGPPSFSDSAETISDAWEESVDHDGLDRLLRDMESKGLEQELIS